jgi:hypothetical protein
VALQGTIDAFPLPEVLQLLSSPAKSGCLVVEGDRGTARLWIDSGEVIGGGPRFSSVSPAASLVFEMLRFATGSFSFVTEIDLAPELEVPATPIPTCLQLAADLAEAWAEVESVLPSSGHRVVPPRALGAESTTLDRTAWALIVAAEGARSVGELGELLGMEEYDVCQATASLIRRGLLELREPLGETPSVDSHVAAAHDVPVVYEQPGRAFPDRFPIDDLIGTGGHGESASWAASTHVGPESVVHHAAAAADEVIAAHTPVASWDDLAEMVGPPAAPVRPTGGEVAGSTSAENDEVLRQVSWLSPQAAEAIAAALHASPSQDSTEGDPLGPDAAEGPFS